MARDRGMNNESSASVQVTDMFEYVGAEAG